MLNTNLFGKNRDMKNSIFEKGCSAQNWAKSVVLSMAVKRDCPRSFVPAYSNRLVFNILNGPECFSGLGDRRPSCDQRQCRPSKKVSYVNGLSVIY